MSTLPQFFGTASTNSNPGLEIGNATALASWSQIITDKNKSAGGVSGAVLAVGSQSTTGAISAPLLALDTSGNLGIEGAAFINGAEISAGSGFPTATPATSGSMYLRTDGATNNPRLYQWQSLPNSNSTWLEVPLGLGIFNVKDYGAVGDGDNDDTAAIAAAMSAATSHELGGGMSGAIVFFPPGQYPVYKTDSTVTPITGQGNLTICGKGSASQIMVWNDLDVFSVDSAAAGLTIRDLQITWAGNNTSGGISGAGIYCEGGLGTFHVENVDTSLLGFGVFSFCQNGSAHITNCKFGANTAGAYIAGGAEIHHSTLNGQTYGLIADGSQGIKMTNSALYGVTSLATWTTNQGGGDQNTIYGYDVEANFSDPYSGDNLPPTTSTAVLFHLSGVGSEYTIITNSVSGDVWITTGSVIYVQSTAGGGNLGVGGFISNIVFTDPSGNSEFTFQSNFESTTVTAGMDIGSNVWMAGPPYPVQLGGESPGSASLLAVGSQLKLADCWFQDGTIIGGSGAALFTTTTSSVPLTTGGTTTVHVDDTSIFQPSGLVWIQGPSATGAVSGSVAGVGASTITMHVAWAGGPSSGSIDSGAVITVGWPLRGLPFFQLPSPKTNYTYPLSPDVTIQGGSWSVEYKTHYPIGQPAGPNVLTVLNAEAIAISDTNNSVGDLANGFSISIASGVSNCSIVGNNISLGSDSAGAVQIIPTSGVNCQANLISGVGAATSIVWPSGSIATSGVFAIANNPGFNPAGLSDSLSFAGTSGLAANVYGIPGTMCIYGGTGVDVLIQNAQTGGYTSTHLSGGAFHLEPGGQLKLTYSGAPSAVFISD